MFHKLEMFIGWLQQNVIYAAFIAALALFSVVLLLLEIWYGNDYPELVPISQRIDIIIAWIFLVDFFAGLLLNREVTRKEYWQQNWLNLVSSIPISSEVTRTLRILRIFRAVRAIRGGMNLWFAQRRWARNRKLDHSR